VESDATPQNMGVLWEYLEKNGRMVDVYTDRDSMFTASPRAGETEQQRREADRLTQLVRAYGNWESPSVSAAPPPPSSSGSGISHSRAVRESLRFSAFSAAFHSSARLHWPAASGRVSSVWRMPLRRV
jgi:hypothetical protein